MQFLGGGPLDGGVDQDGGSDHRLLWNAYAAASRLLLDGAFSETSINAQITELELLRVDEIAADTVSSQSTQEWRDEVEEMLDAAGKKRSYIVGKL